MKVPPCTTGATSWSSFLTIPYHLTYFLPFKKTDKQPCNYGTFSLVDWFTEKIGDIPSIEHGADFTYGDTYGQTLRARVNLRSSALEVNKCRWCESWKTFASKSSLVEKSGAIFFTKRTNANPE